jgi:hypothetical protein
MPANYVLLERIELNASASSVSFQNIPQSGYTDLKIVMSARITRSGSVTDIMNVSFNGTSTNESSRRLEGNGSSASSASNALLLAYQASSTDATANTFGNAEFYIPNYTSSNFKSASNDGVSENNGTTAYAGFAANLWSNTAAITSITFTPDAGSDFVQYSSFSLYGLAALGTTPVIAPKASGGNIDNDGTYWYHTFLTTGAFVPATGLSCDVLVVAGGGAGGRGVGGGGGAGGLLLHSSQSLANGTSYVCTIGAGGAEPTSSVEISGNNSQFASLTASVGGGGGGDAGNGLTGGSGGGASGTSDFTGGSLTSGQGNNGGSTSGSSPLNGGAGGGGAGGAGSANSGLNGGNGGAGTNTYSSWASATSTGVSGFYAGGGAGGSRSYDLNNGGAGGSGGGGNGGGVNQNSTAGTINAGAGGGGGTNDSPNKVGRAGGSGIIIIRYPIA